MPLLMTVRLCWLRSGVPAFAEKSLLDALLACLYHFWTLAATAHKWHCAYFARRAGPHFKQNWTCTRAMNLLLC